MDGLTVVFVLLAGLFLAEFLFYLPEFLRECCDYAKDLWRKFL